MPPKKSIPVKSTVKASSSGTKAGTSSTTKKGTGKAKKGSSNTNISAPEVRKWTPKDDAARKIQTKIRQYLAKKALLKKRKEKEEYEETMDRLEREAYLHMVKMQQEEIERKQLKEDEERKRKNQERQRKKRILEAAFDGDVGTMESVLKEVSDEDTKNGISQDVVGRALRTRHQMAILECEDPNNNTVLSEAANGGHADAVKFLLERGANPNVQGQFKRTPLYRAAFMGHLEVTQLLLENGADPRIYAGDSQTPLQVASNDACKQILESWDISQTESLLKQLDAAKQKRQDEEKARRQAETRKLEDVVAEAQKDYEAKQKLLNYAHCELEKRITEHDNATVSGFERTDITLQTIHDQELELESAKLEVEKARDYLSQVRLQLRESMKDEADTTDAQDELPGQKVNIKELDDVLFRDVGNRIKDSGKWPLLIDTSGQASIFLRYRDTNIINTLRPVEVEKNNIRRSLLGALRYGKPFVVDMMEVDMFDTVSDRFDEVQKHLMAKIINKSILKEEEYLKLVVKEDGTEYDRFKFTGMRLNNFKMMVITKNPYPNEKLLDQFYVLRVLINA